MNISGVKSIDDIRFLIQYMIFVITAQHISQPPDVTNNAKSSRQADRVGRGVPSVRVAGNVGMDMDTDCEFLFPIFLFTFCNYFIIYVYISYIYSSSSKEILRYD